MLRWPPKTGHASDPDHPDIALKSRSELSITRWGSAAGKAPRPTDSFLPSAAPSVGLEPFGGNPEFPVETTNETGALDAEEGGNGRPGCDGGNALPRPAGERRRDAGSRQRWPPR